MKYSDVEYDNQRVSKEPPQSKQVLLFIFVIIIGLVPVIGIFLLLAIGSTFSKALEITTSVSLGMLLLEISIFSYVWVHPYRIIYNDNEFVVINKRSKRRHVKYREISDFFFSYYSYDINGDPCPRWIVGWKGKYFTRQINLTERNAKRLAKILDEKGIQYKWDDHLREAWEEKTGWKPEEVKQSEDTSTKGES